MHLFRHKYCMLLAKLTSVHSTCNDRFVGAVLVQDDRIIAIGCNENALGSLRCIDEKMIGDLPYCHRRIKYGNCPTETALDKVLNIAESYGISLEGATLYQTLEPSQTEVQRLAQVQIKNVYYELPIGDWDWYPGELKKSLKSDSWEKNIAAANFNVYQQLTIDEITIKLILPFLESPTSVRRLPI